MKETQAWNLGVVGRGTGEIGGLLGVFLWGGGGGWGGGFGGGWGGGGGGWNGRLRPWDCGSGMYGCTCGFNVLTELSLSLH